MRTSSFPRPCIPETYYFHSKPKSKSENKVEAAKKHSEAEKRRRNLINAKYNVLRGYLPTLINQHQNSSSVLAIGNEYNRVKTDKASILVETIKQFEKLEKGVQGVEIPSKEEVFTSEECNNNNQKQGLVKATMSCEVRATLKADIKRAMELVKAKVVKAEVVTMGGRTRIVMWVQGLVAGKEGVKMLRRTLKDVMHKPIHMTMQVQRFTQR
ncbi:hypothetical protein RIF29_36357 [Crotalaria pallida]|uniref:BHLH domain-containing protein n=1 Tax=Crotalaria pallida TaxID=3830 RepID=A0AAN9HYI1_CROPI